jgi:hypothetical protein
MYRIFVLELKLKYIFSRVKSLYWGGWIAESVYRLDTDCKAVESEFKSREEQNFSPLHVVQTGSGAQQSYPTGISRR